jgi:hypothetical protein
MSIDPETQEKGKQLQDILRLFKQATTQPLSSFILQTPVYKNKTSDAVSIKDSVPQNLQRQSPRLKAKNNDGNTISKMAQDVVAKKCGLLQQEENLDEMTLQRYIQMYNQPLTDTSMQAILQLTEVAVDKKSNQMKKGKSGKAKKDKKKSKMAVDAEFAKPLKTLLSKKQLKKKGLVPARVEDTEA